MANRTETTTNWTEEDARDVRETFPNRSENSLRSERDVPRTVKIIQAALSGVAVFGGVAFASSESARAQDNEEVGSTQVSEEIQDESESKVESLVGKTYVLNTDVQAGESLTILANSTVTITHELKTKIIVSVEHKAEQTEDEDDQSVTATQPTLQILDRSVVAELEKASLVEEIVPEIEASEPVTRTVSVSFKPVIVVAANVREHPSTESKIITSLSQGDEVEIVAVRGDDWTEIRLEKDGEIYNIHSSLLGPVSKEEERVVVMQQEPADGIGGLANANMYEQAELFDYNSALEVFGNNYKEAFSVLPEKTSILNDQETQTIEIAITEKMMSFVERDNALHMLVTTGENTIDFMWFGNEEHPERNNWQIFQLSTPGTENYPGLEMYLDSNFNEKNASRTVDFKHLTRSIRLPKIEQDYIEREGALKTWMTRSETQNADNYSAMFDWFEDNHFDLEANTLTLEEYDNLTHTPLDSSVEAFFKLLESSDNVAVEDNIITLDDGRFIDKNLPIKIIFMRFPDQGDGTGLNHLGSRKSTLFPENPYHINKSGQLIIEVTDITGLIGHAVVDGWMIGSSMFLKEELGIEGSQTTEYGDYPLYAEISSGLMQQIIISQNDEEVRVLAYPVTVLTENATDHEVVPH